MKLLEGKSVIITGAGHGVGRGYALLMAEHGAKVLVNDLGGAPQGGGSDQRAADEVVEIIRSRGGEAVANYADVSDFDAAKAMVDQAIDAFGGLDVLVLNAGILRDKMIFNMDESDWDSVIKVHLKGHFAPARHATAYWREKSREIGGKVNASVICTTSSVGLLGNTGQTNYAAAKGGIAMFSVALAQDMMKYGVRSNAIAPSGTTRLIGITRGTDIAEIAEPDQYTEYDPRDPGNVAPLAVWLASDLSRHVNGQAFFSQGSRVTHFSPWTPNGVVGVSDKQWDPEELDQAMNTVVFGTSHGGLRSGVQWGGTSALGG
ncbi:MAG: SDR family oxidoreductase [Candidatus Nanopelagicales bacterium]|nr:SDR family oxidoreductase [Candidatus Nanopelagicales bacterium]